MTTIEILRKNLEKASQLLKAYLFNLAKQDPEANFWQQQVNGTLSGYPQRILQELHENFVELAEKNENLSEQDKEAYAATQVTCCLLSVFEDKNPPQENTLDALKILYQTLYTPGQLIPVTEDITPEVKENIEIYEQDTTYLVCILSKAHFLFYIVDNYEKIKTFIATFPQLTENHSNLLSLNISWLEKEFQVIKKVSEKPYLYSKSTIMPEMGGYIPLEALQEEHGHSFWQSLWQTHLILPWKLRFAIGRLHARFAAEDYRVESYYAKLPISYKNKHFLSQFIFYLCFWTHLYLVYHLFKSAYLQTIWQNIKTSFNYIRGSHSFLSGVPFAFNLSVDLLKLLYFPLVLTLPVLLGISSLPFLVFRRLSETIPSYFLRTNLRIMLDVFETLKDITLLLGTFYVLTPLLSASLILPSAFAILGSIVSTFFCLILIIALTAVGLSPQILVLILGMGGYNKLVELAFSPLISLGGIIGILSFPLALAILTLPRFVVEMAYHLQSLSVSSSPSQEQELNPNLTPLNEYDPIEELQLFVKNHAFLVQYDEIKGSPSEFLNLDVSILSKEDSLDKKPVFTH